MRVLLAVGLLLLSAVTLADFRCQSKIISAGMTQDQVAHWCGQPNATYHWTAVEAYYESRYPTRRSTYQVNRPTQELGVAAPRPVYVSVHYNRWTYNFGSNQFIKYLVFRNGVLQEIDEGGYGN